MLVLSRRSDESIVIDRTISIRVLSIRGNSVRLGIEAPDSVTIVRGELQRNLSIVETVANVDAACLASTAP